MHQVTLVIDLAFILVCIVFFAAGGLGRVKKILARKADLIAESIGNSESSVSKSNSELDRVLDLNSNLDYECSKIIQEAQDEYDSVVSNFEKELQVLLSNKVSEASRSVERSSFLFLKETKERCVDFAIDSFIDFLSKHPDIVKYNNDLDLAFIDKKSSDSNIG